MWVVRIPYARRQGLCTRTEKEGLQHGWCKSPYAFLMIICSMLDLMVISAVLPVFLIKQRRDHVLPGNSRAETVLWSIIELG